MIRSRRALRPFSALVLGAVLLAGCGREPVAPPTAPPPGEAAQPNPDLVIGTGFGSVEMRTRAGGSRDASTFHTSCAGLVPEMPSARLRVSDAGAVTLSASPIGTGFIDLTMVVVGPAEGDVRCGDDGATLEPIVSAVLEPGDYAIYVGVRTTDRPPVTIRVTEGLNDTAIRAFSDRFPPPIVSGDPPVRIGEGSGGDAGGLQLGANTAPGVLRGVSGGPREASSVLGGCAGFVAHHPDHRLEITEPVELTLRVVSRGDTTLLLVSPDGAVQCADDEDGLQPVIRRSFSPGTWSLNVGSFERDARHDYELHVAR